MPVDERQTELPADLRPVFAHDEGEEHPGREGADADPRTARHWPDVRVDAGGRSVEARQQLDRVPHPHLPGAGGERLDARRAVARGRTPTGEEEEEDREQPGETISQGHEGSLRTRPLRNRGPAARARAA
jgi:hypothetical protein